ncbi:MAG: hypothetical protein OM95_01135 [Bdellovibrio sp. ArHS]|uniref:L,D-transpeptidase family protein n=1 Tax=Bdellovibrio sp. ArHS TaxID=1569284 RepID=UPI0005839442|nr:L,D-transpeptidase family protein [Bdellovibrio sp. ArHS]KHD89708.1 MAG: hypothetical protein OM95_01135 [Bdellovibrio sp. ArHS]
MKLILIAFLHTLLLMGTQAKAQFTQAARADYLNVIDELDLGDMRNTMLNVGNEGLNPNRYWTTGMEQAWKAGGYWDANLKRQANENFLLLLEDMNGGVVDPGTMGSDVKMTKKSFVSDKQLRVLMYTHGLRSQPLLMSFSSQSAPYIALKEALRRITSYCNNGLWGSLPPPSKKVELGGSDPAIPAWKERLRLLGYKVTSVDQTFDTQMMTAINDIQWLNKVVPDGSITATGSTYKYLNTGCVERARQIRLDMEKLRWFPQTFEDRYIYVNLAMTQFNLIDKQSGTSMNFRTINGRTARPSPTMKDKIVYIVINPYWVVPPTIFREDKMEDLKGLSPSQITEYFDSHNYELWNSTFTKRVDPSTVDWNSLDPNSDNLFYIRQRPHLGNALGVLKFMMTNPYAIYLHDTNQRELFADGQRQLSSGCIRLEQPVELAEYLLKGTNWNRGAIESAMAKPGEVMENDTRVNLQKPIPVYLVFQTSSMNSDGVIRFSEDTYRQGARLLQRGAF